MIESRTGVRVGAMHVLAQQHLETIRTFVRMSNLIDVEPLFELVLGTELLNHISQNSQGREMYEVGLPIYITFAEEY